MFTYTLSGKAIESGKVRVTVDYTNGTVTYSETFFITSKDDLDNKITAKLAELEANVLLAASITPGAYTKTEKVAEPIKPPTATEAAENKLYELKRLIDLGVLEDTDKAFTDAVAEYKAVSSK